jgi:hypothetical protein
MGTKQNVYGQMCLVITKHILDGGKWAVRKEKKRKELLPAFSTQG